MTERFLSLPSVTEDAQSTALDCDVVIIGGGIAGLSVALSLPAEWRVVLVTKHALGESNTRYAQGGLAAPVGMDDSPELHLQDTIAAGAGLVSEHAARVLVSEAREAVSWLIAVGTRFDTTDDSSDSSLDLAARYDLAREAAHSRRRVLHAHGDATGAEIERALVRAIRQRPAATILEETAALDLTTEQGVCSGVLLWRKGSPGHLIQITSRHGVMLANGGAGQLWKRTSNPVGATADGLALALRAGAALADLEFVQFHPTVLLPPQEADEPFLISEAVRGEGAYLRNAAGERFMPRYHPDAELAPRDVVARAIQSELMSGGAATAYLDLRHLPETEVRERFPTIGAVCRRYGLDLAHDLIPVAPAAHYFMGGVVVDTFARTTLPRLYAVGEVACTGVHGANRLASNSLLEGLVFGRRAARSMVEDPDFWPESPALPGDTVSLLDLVPPTSHQEAPPDALTRSSLRKAMWEHVGLRRDATGLLAAQRRLRQLAASGVKDPETANMLLAAQAVTACALARTESRGGHYRADFPESDPQRAGRHTLVPAPRLPSAEQTSEGLASYAHI